MDVILNSNIDEVKDLVKENGRSASYVDVELWMDVKNVAPLLSGSAWAQACISDYDYGYYFLCGTGTVSSLGGGYLYRWNVNDEAATKLMQIDKLSYYSRICSYGNYIYIISGDNDEKYFYRMDLSAENPVLETLAAPSYYTYGCGMTADGSGNIHIFGGTKQPTNHYKWDGSSWTKVSTMPVEMSDCAAGYLNGYIFVLGSADTANIYGYTEEDGWETIPVAGWGGSSSNANCNSCPVTFDQFNGRICRFSKGYVYSWQPWLEEWEKSSLHTVTSDNSPVFFESGADFWMLEKGAAVHELTATVLSGYLQKGTRIFSNEIASYRMNVKSGSIDEGDRYPRRKYYAEVVETDHFEVEFWSDEPEFTIV